MISFGKNTTFGQADASRVLSRTESQDGDSSDSRYSQYADDQLDGNIIAEPPYAVNNSSARSKTLHHKIRKAQTVHSDSEKSYSPTDTSRSRMAISNLIHTTSPLHSTAIVPITKQDAPTGIPTANLVKEAPRDRAGFAVPKQMSGQPPLSSLPETRSTIPNRSVHTQDYLLEVCQQPIWCEATDTSERAIVDRKTIEPSPVVQLAIYNDSLGRKWRRSAAFIMCANLYDPFLRRPVTRMQNDTLSGTTVASRCLARGKNGFEVGYFVFYDIGIKMEGQFRLQFNLHEMLDGGKLEFITSILSDIFTVYFRQETFLPLQSTLPSYHSSYHGGQLRNLYSAPAALAYDAADAAKAFPAARFESMSAGSPTQPTGIVPSIPLQKASRHESHNSHRSPRSPKNSSALGVVGDSSSCGSSAASFAQSTGSSNNGDGRNRRGIAKSDWQRKSDDAEMYNRTKDRWQEFIAQLKLYSPR